MAIFRLVWSFLKEEVYIQILENTQILKAKTPMDFFLIK